MDGRIHFATSLMTGGGVARNICEALSKLGCRPVFISVLGNDPQGTILKNFIPKNNLERVKVLEGYSTGQCTVILDRKGECKFLAGDMDIHRQITPEMILENKEVITGAPLLVIDANLSVPTIETILKLAEQNDIPVLFEPTDLEISIKPFQTNNWKAIKFITPNISELKFIASHFKISFPDDPNDKFEEVVHITSRLVDYIDNIIVTLGDDGVIIARRGKATEPFLSLDSNSVGIRHYPTVRCEKVASVSGAGDSLASGVIAGMLRGLSEEECLSVGLAAAGTALVSSGPVADKLFDKDHLAWRSRAKYRTLV